MLECVGCEECVFAAGDLGLQELGILLAKKSIRQGAYGRVTSISAHDIGFFEAPPRSMWHP